MKDIGAAIQEVMESYEVEVAGKVFPVKAIRNITGHDILRYHIHGGKQIPFIKNNSRQKMEEGEVFAIETFGTTGTAYLNDGVRTLLDVLFFTPNDAVSNSFVGGSVWLREE
jgi:methionyl aminopeptidase